MQSLSKSNLVKFQFTFIELVTCNTVYSLNDQFG